MDCLLLSLPLCSPFANAPSASVRTHLLPPASLSSRLHHSSSLQTTMFRPVVLASALLMASTTMSMPTQLVVEERSLDLTPGQLEMNQAYFESGPSSSRITYAEDGKPFIYEGMRIMHREAYEQEAIQHNIDYQASLRQIRTEFVEGQFTSALSYSGDLWSFQADSDARIEQANDAFIQACTVKVLADLQNINAYHRYLVQASHKAFTEAVSAPSDHHLVNLYQLREAHTEATANKIYGDKEILLAAEEECMGTMFDKVYWTEEMIQSESEKQFL